MIGVMRARDPRETLSVSAVSYYQKLYFQYLKIVQ
jgi:hypothetical protein